MATLPSTIEPTIEGTQKSVEPRVLINNFGDGYRQRAADGINNVRQTWTVEFIGSTTNIDIYDAFFEARKGYDAFDWTPPHESTARKFTCSKWQRIYVGPSTDRIIAQFTEEFDL